MELWKFMRYRLEGTEIHFECIVEAGCFSDKFQILWKRTFLIQYSGKTYDLVFFVLLIL